MLDYLLTGDGISRRAKKLLEKGTPAPATIAGIRYIPGAQEAPDRWEYGLRVDGAGGSLFGIRQNLTPQGERAHLGASVVVRQDGDRAIVDWPASMAAWGVEGAVTSAASWKMVDPPEEGSIEDRGQRAARKRIERGDPVEIEVVEVARSEGLGGFLYAWDLRLRAGGADHELSKVNVPGYAVHLLVPSMKLAGAGDDEGIEIDWGRSAEEAGRGRATGFDFDAQLPPVPEQDGKIEDMDEWMAEFDKWKEK